MNDSVKTTGKSPVLFLILLFTIEAQAVPGALREEDTLDSLKQTLLAINRLLIFFEQNVDKVNLDAIYGLRVAEGALKRSLTEVGYSFWKATAETNRIRRQVVEYSKRAGLVCNHAQTSIEKQGEFYYNRFKDVVNKPWTFFLDFGKRQLPITVSNENSKEVVKHKWDEERSDECMSEVLGSNVNHTKCLFSDKCIEALTDRQMTGYGPTHQILFLTLSFIKKCNKKYSQMLVDHAGIDLDGLIKIRCVQILNEMLTLERQGVTDDKQDLYMEQAFVCAMHGYEEFLSLKRLANILGWQTNSGCFGNFSEEMASSGSSMDKRRRRRHPESFGSMRRLLVDVMLENGCSSHESGVAAGLLGLYTTWLLTKLKMSFLAQTKITLMTTMNYVTTNLKQRGMDYVDEDKELYMLAILVSFITTVLTLFLVFLIYKLCSYCRSNRTGNAYKKLETSDGDKYLI